MPDAPAPPTASTSLLRSFSRQLSKGQKRGLLAGIASTIGGFGGQVYDFFIADPLTDKNVRWNATISAHALTAGLAFIAAFIVFFLLRRFLFRAAAIVSLVLLAGGAISYFTGINIDLSKAQQTWDSAAGWLWQQGKSLISLVSSNIPGSGGAGLGAWLGFRRPRV